MVVCLQMSLYALQILLYAVTVIEALQRNFAVRDESFRLQTHVDPFSLTVGGAIEGDFKDFLCACLGDF